MRRSALGDDQWDRIEQLLPGKPVRKSRTISDPDIRMSGNARNQGCEHIVYRRGPRGSGNINSSGMNQA